MKSTKLNNLLVFAIIILSIIASTYGFFSSDSINENQTIQSIHGETIELYGKGLYHNDSVSMASQERAQDIVTLVIAIPLLIVSLILNNKKSIKGKLLLTGTLGYFLYVYMSYAFLSSYNKFFLLFISIMSISFFAFVINITSSELKDLSKHFSKQFPRKYIGVFLIIVGILISLMWFKRIVPSIGSENADGLQHYTTL